MPELPFQVGHSYTREQIQVALGQSPSTGGDWFTGYHREGDTVFVFSTVGMPGRTGHDYGDRWLADGTFEWYGKTKSALGQPLIDFMIGDLATVLLFTREHDRQPFEFQGRVIAAQIFNEVPVRIIWKRA